MEDLESRDASISFVDIPPPTLPEQKRMNTFVVLRRTREVRLDVSMLRCAIQPLQLIFDLTSFMVRLEHDTRAYLPYSF